MTNVPAQLGEGNEYLARIRDHFAETGQRQRLGHRQELRSRRVDQPCQRLGLVGPTAGLRCAQQRA